MVSFLFDCLIMLISLVLLFILNWVLMRMVCFLLLMRVELMGKMLCLFGLYVCSFKVVKFENVGNSRVEVKRVWVSFMLGFLWCINRVIVYCVLSWINRLK